MKLRIGIVGVSSDWQTRYLPALRVLRERFEITGVYDSVSMLAENVARECAAPRFSGYREMLRRDDVDAAFVLSNDWYELAPVRAACDFGKAVYCGSEIVFRPEDATAFSKEVDEAGIAFMAEFPRRYAPASLRLKELIATQLGPPQLLFCHRRLKSPRKTDSSHRSEPAAALRQERELIELIDWCSFVVGQPPRTIHAQCHLAHEPVIGDIQINRASKRTGQYDYQALSIDFSPAGEAAKRTIAQISCGSYIRPSWTEAANFRPPSSLQVCCENGLAFIDLPNGLTWFDDAGRHQESLETEVGVGQQLLTQFHRAVTSLVRKMGDLEDINRCLRTLEAARRSSETGQTVPI